MVKKKAKLKVFGCRYFHYRLPGGYGRVIVATTSMTSAAKLCRMTNHEMRNYGSITGNGQECATALAKPYVAFLVLNGHTTKPKFKELEPFIQEDIKEIMES